MDWEQLIECISRSRWDYNLRAAYFSLLNALHLEQEVCIRQLIQGEFIFAVGSTPFTSTSQDDSSERRPSLQEQSAISHEINSTFSTCRLSPRLLVPLNQLKEVVFSTLETTLRENTYSCRMMNSSDRSHILVPLLTAVNSFLVLGMMGGKEDRQRLLALLHPSLASKKKGKNRQRYTCIQAVHFPKTSLRKSHTTGTNLQQAKPGVSSRLFEEMKLISWSLLCVFLSAQFSHARLH